MIGPTAILEPLVPSLQATIREIVGDDFDLRFPESVEPESFRAVLSGADYAVVRALPLPEAVLRQAQSLRLIHQWGTGVDGIPVATAAAMGIAVARCTGVNAPTVADVTLALMLAVLRRIPQTSTALKNGRWQAPELWQTARDLTGAEVGLIGFGSIAQAVAKRLSGFDCQVSYWRRSGPLDGNPAQFRELDQLLGSVDVLSLHIPLNEQTRGFLGADRLARMKPGAVLINTARGGLVDEAALVAALQGGQLGGAGLDVFASEPTAPSNPLLGLDSTVVLPHVGGRTRDNLHRMVRHWSTNIRRHAAGEPIAEIDMV